MVLLKKLVEFASYRDNTVYGMVRAVELDFKLPVTRHVNAVLSSHSS